MLKTVHVRIEGIVQGVGFRAWTERTALDNGLTGWVANREDGAVEAVFQGLAGPVTEVLSLCRRGPMTAAVRRIVILGEPADRYAVFEIRSTF